MQRLITDCPDVLPIILQNLSVADVANFSQSSKSAYAVVESRFNGKLLRHPELAQLNSISQASSHVYAAGETVLFGEMNAKIFGAAFSAFIGYAFCGLPSLLVAAACFGARTPHPHSSQLGFAENFCCHAAGTLGTIGFFTSAYLSNDLVSFGKFARNLTYFVKVGLGSVFIANSFTGELGDTRPANAAICAAALGLYGIFKNQSRLESLKNQRKNTREQVEATYALGKNK
jgi:hypothetical protein